MRYQLAFFDPIGRELCRFSLEETNDDALMAYLEKLSHNGDVEITPQGQLPRRITLI